MTFSAEVTVAHAIVNRTGKVTRELPASRYRLEQLDGRRVEDDDVGHAANPRQRCSGRCLRRHHGGYRCGNRRAAGARRAGQDAPAGLDLGPADAPGRARRRTRRHPSGRARRSWRLDAAVRAPLGSVRALHRYLARRGRVVEEALVAPDTAAAARARIASRMASWSSITPSSTRRWASTARCGSAPAAKRRCPRARARAWSR